MKSTYDKIADAIYLTFKKGKVSSTVKLSDRLIVDLDKKGNTLGIEILDAKNQLEAKDLFKGKKRSTTSPEKLTLNITHSS